jgi:hypothetical protein
VKEVASASQARRLAIQRRPESELVNAVLAALPLLGVTAWRNQSGMLLGSHKGKKWAVRMSLPGVSDIIGFSRTGQIVAIECKRGGADPTAEQMAFLVKVKAAGGIAVLARAVSDVLAAFGR